MRRTWKVRTSGDGSVRHVHQIIASFQKKKQLKLENFSTSASAQTNNSRIKVEKCAPCAVRRRSAEQNLGISALSGPMGRCCPTSLHREAAMNVLLTRRQTSRKTQKSVSNHNLLLTDRFRQNAGLILITADVVWPVSELWKCVFLSREPRGVRSKRIRQKERLVRYETPPSAAGGGTPGKT